MEVCEDIFEKYCLIEYKKMAEDEEVEICNEERAHHMFSRILSLLIYEFVFTKYIVFSAVFLQRQKWIIKYYV